LERYLPDEVPPPLNEEYHVDIFLRLVTNVGDETYSNTHSNYAFCGDAKGGYIL
jgi:hypothetical protein